MKILVVSDTHRKMDNLYKVVEKEKPLDMIIHCGDIEESADYLRGMVNCPVCVVAGNNDFFHRYDKELVIPLCDGFKGLVTHGNQYYISMGVEMLANEARARGVDFAFFGHTHRPYCNIVNGVQMINPGSLSYPRQDNRLPSYAILNIDNGAYKCDIHYFEN